MLPGEKEIGSLHSKYAPTEEAFDSIFTHCQVVWDIAEQIINKRNLPVNYELVRAGCLLHDIGVYKFYSDEGVLTYDQKTYATHGLLGIEILKAEGIGKELQDILRNHIGVGLTKGDIKQGDLPLPPDDYVPRTVEERLVTYSDNFHSKSAPPVFRTAAWYREHIGARFPGKEKIFDEWIQEFGEPDLAPLIQKYGHSLDS